MQCPVCHTNEIELRFLSGLLNKGRRNPIFDETFVRSLKEMITIEIEKPNKKLVGFKKKL